MLSVQHLSVAYGSKQAVTDVSFQLGEGEVIGILGANGAGKSSTIAGILGIERSTFSELTILERSPIQHRREVFRGVGVQFQETAFPDRLTVQEACQQWAALYEETLPAGELLHTFGLAGKEQQSVNSLSGGERQRLAVLLALIHRPKLVFLDELTTGLDPVARRLLWQRLLTMKQQGLSMVLTSHYMDEVEILCDDILILRHGCPVFQGTVAEALHESGKTSLEEAYLGFAGAEMEGIWHEDRSYIG